MSCNSPFQSKEKTLAFTLKISTISEPRHKKSHQAKDLGCTKTTRDVHMRHARDAHVGNSMRRDSPVFLGMFFTTMN